MRRPLDIHLEAINDDQTIKSNEPARTASTQPKP